MQILAFVSSNYPVDVCIKLVLTKDKRLVICDGNGRQLEDVKSESEGNERMVELYKEEYESQMRRKWKSEQLRLEEG